MLCRPLWSRKGYRARAEVRLLERANSTYISSCSDRIQSILGAWLNEVHAPYDHTAKGCWINACLPWEHSPSGIDLDDWSSASAAVSVSLPFGLEVIETELARLQLCAVKVCFLHLGCLAKCVCHSPIMITVKGWKNREQSWWLHLADESAFLYLCDGHF